MDFDFSMPFNIVSSTRAVTKNRELFKNLGETCLIVTGGKSALASGALADVEEALGFCNINYCVFSEITPNPLLSDCHKAGTLARQLGADFIIGIGGGSALDGAKAAAVYCTNPSFSPIDIYTSKRKPALPLVLIGTTAGTGSEIGCVSVLTNGETGRKKSISGADLFPRLTFADSSYTESMPYSVTVSTALDALSHAIEGFYSKSCGDIPAMFAEKAIPMIWEGLVQLEKTRKVPGEEMREQLYYGSLYAGVVLASCKTAFPHPLGYVLTENYSVPHGVACAVFLPELMRRGSMYEAEKTKRLLKLMKTDEDGFRNTVFSLVGDLNIKMTKDEIISYCSRWDGEIPKNFKATPGGFTKSNAELAFFVLFG